MLMVALNPLAAIEATAATADAMLLAFVTVSMAIFADALRRGPSRSRVLWLTIFLALAQLTKGPVGLAVPAVVMIATLAIIGRSAPRGLATMTAAALAASTGVFLLWAGPADVAAGGRFLREGLGREVIGRALAPLDGHGGSLLLFLPFYAAVILVGFAPWTLYLAGWPAQVREALASRASRPEIILIAAWMAGPFVMFSLAATKLPHYILPIWPPLALAAAAALDADAGGAPSRTRVWMSRGLWLLAPAAALECAAAAALVLWPPLPGVRWPAAATLGAVVVAYVAAIAAHRAGRYVTGAVRLIAGTAVGLTLTAGWLIPQAEALKPAPAIARAIERATPPSAQVWTFEFAEPTLDFYLRRPPIGRLVSDEAALEWTRTSSLAVLVTTRSALDRLEERGGPLPLLELAAVRGVDYSRGRLVELVALLRAPAR
jgi:4-amino-4-deoxy-L-arabinose transferase-like glycosyltransferase